MNSMYPLNYRDALCIYLVLSLIIMLIIDSISNAEGYLADSVFNRWKLCLGERDVAAISPVSPIGRRGYLRD